MCLVAALLLLSHAVLVPHHSTNAATNTAQHEMKSGETANDTTAAYTGCEEGIERNSKTRVSNLRQPMFSWTATGYRLQDSFIQACAERNTLIQPPRCARAVAAESPSSDRTTDKMDSPRCALLPLCSSPPVASVFPLLLSPVCCCLLSCLRVRVPRASRLGPLSSATQAQAREARDSSEGEHRGRGRGKREDRERKHAASGQQNL